MRSRLSIVVILFILAALHIFIGWQILPALPVSTSVKWLGAGWLLLSFLLIPAGLLASFIKRQPLSDRLAWIGLLAMGMFSSLLMLTLLREIVLLIARWSEVPAGRFLTMTTITAIAVPLLASASTLLGFFNARRLARVVRVDVPISELPAGLQGFTIAQISDIHVGPTIKRGYLAKIVRRVNTLGADVIAVTGDLVDGSVARLAPHTAPLADLKAQHGVYFVTGNHEYYSNADAWIAEVRRLGLTVLMNEHVVLKHQGEALLLAGVTDFGAHHFDESHRSDPRLAMNGAKSDVAFRLLLAHQPRSAMAAADAGFDLQLSGHTHGGQFFPWNLFVPLQQPFTAGLNKLRNLWVYTSRGTGYWGPPKRIWAPSEITLLRLVLAA
ncbi:metallophosphoesterase [Glaciimonas sp. PAMC28666]|uniref:metallophosphoesterase n=1 Tax=Glaciimonas sp. PAMC28666 TaxID=2807626 RepID=UPI0019625F2A|nr:metallophosphoesterase [Glaciimonas sp. PAMC28666]QRX84343.1 metallophosphoesterase [Glaciimonas sp. PAMC28666]